MKPWKVNKYGQIDQIFKISKKTWNILFEFK